jgi:hypothetical protein
MLFFLITAPLLVGCYIKLIEPKAPVSTGKMAEYQAKNLKFSYYINGDDYSHHVEKALLDSFSAFEIHDVIKSEGFAQDRINIIIYALDKKQTTRIGRYVGFSWALVSMVTLYLVPMEGILIYPVEIHLVRPDREVDKQFRSIQTQYVIDGWTWLPLLFKGNQEKGDDAAYFNFSATKYDTYKEKFEHTGLRRIFDEAIMEAVRD